MSGIETAAARLRDWAVRSALPYWASRGFDAEGRRFHEGLTLDGKPLDAPIRLIVQARQVYSFTVAARYGWHPQARELAEAAYLAMCRDHYQAGGRDGWAYTVRRDGSVADARRDFYSHAFALLAIASHVEASGKRDALALADETLVFLDRDMKATSGGFIEGLPRLDVPRRQNPHMHLLESLLALWQVSRETKYLVRAGEVFDLFRDRFFQSPEGVLGEYYDERLSPAAGETGKVVEPGHHYEWIWLLRWYETASGQDVQFYVDALYDHADRYGFSTRGLVVDELLSNGRVRKSSHRTWPMTEAIKANAVEAARGRPGAAGKCALLVARLFDHFLATETPGGWVDRLDGDARPTADHIPASTLYHVMCALHVLHTTAGRHA
jgi:mannose-6-phosphate isomerase